MAVSSRQYHLLLLLDSPAFYRACSSTLSQRLQKFTCSCLFSLCLSLFQRHHFPDYPLCKTGGYSISAYIVSRPNPDIRIVIITDQSLPLLLFSNLYLQNGLTPHSHFCPDECIGTTQDSSQWFTVMRAP